MIKDLTTYMKTNANLVNDLEESWAFIIRDMEKNILKSLKATASTANATVNAVSKEKRVQEFVEKIYKAEEWQVIQKEVYSQSSTVLKAFQSKFWKNINELKKVYPESDFQVGGLKSVWKDYTKFIKEDLDILKLMNATQSDVMGLAQMSRFSLISELTNDVINSIEANLDRPIAHLDTRLRTTTNVMNNKIRQRFYNSIKDNNKIYMYAGVLDGNNRAFCRHNVGRLGTEAQWRALDNGMVGTAWEYLGGYNCRHMLLYVSKNWTKEEIVGIQKGFRS